jgi:hypothetical protein
MFYSRRTTAAESKLHSFELETLCVVYSLKRFRNYLFGLKFMLVTDCQAVKFTLEKKDINPKISRWSIFLEQFTFDIIHRNGDKMSHVDALSRLEVYLMEAEDESLLHKSVFVNQLRDNKIMKLKARVQSESLKDYEIRDGILYRKSRNRLLLYVPHEMINSVLYKYHNMLGHFGIDKTCEMIQRSFYFPKMRNIIATHIKACIMCITYNPPDGKQEGYLFIYDKPDKPFDTIHVDHLGPLETLRNKSAHIFAIVDAFTKMIKVYPTKTTNANEVVKHLESYFREYSVPKRIVSDRGSAFTSKQFDTYLTKYGIKHVLIATASPQSNGQIERYNRTLVPLIAKLVVERDSQWDKVLNEAEFLMNNTFNRSINNIPSKLLYGVCQRRQIESNLVEFCEELNTNVDVSLTEMRQNAVQSVIKGQVYNKKNHDRKTFKNTKYSVNDLVEIKTVKKPGENSKLKPHFKGPYVVKKMLDTNRYVVSDLDGYQVPVENMRESLVRSNCDCIKHLKLNPIMTHQTQMMKA